MSLTFAQTQRRRILVFDDERTTGYQLNAVIGCLLDQAAMGSTRNQRLA
jgi:orotate phosphoribosyltransferase-like protein